jgi:hypothetical protein
MGDIMRKKRSKRVRKDIYIDSEVWELFKRKSRGNFPESEKMVEESRKLRLTVTKIRKPRKLENRFTDKK